MREQKTEKHMESLQSSESVENKNETGKEGNEKKGSTPFAVVRPGGIYLIIPPLNLKVSPITQITLHNLQYALRQAHADQCIRDLRVAVDLSELEECAGDVGWILAEQTKHAKRREKSAENSR
jgi:hypothetical protein